METSIHLKTMSHILLLTLLFLSPSAQAGKAEREQRREVRVQRMLQADLRDVSKGYWKALRWRDLDAAGMFLEDPEQRLALLTHPEQREYRSVDILQVTVHPKTDEPDAQRQADVVVELQYMDSAQVLQRELLRQRWYHTGVRWYVEPGQEYGLALEAPR